VGGKTVKKYRRVVGKIINLPRAERKKVVTMRI
jgi:hypothetical protein